MELMASVLKPAAALPSLKNFDSTGRRADGCAELPLKATARAMMRAQQMMAVDALKRLRPFQSVGLVAR